MRRIDLVPPSYRQRRREKNSLLIAGVAIGLVVLLLVGWWFWLGLKVNDAETELAEVQAANAELDAEIQANGGLMGPADHDLVFGADTPFAQLAGERGVIR